ncbi:TonB-dependent receptor [Flavobacterium sp. ASW18X]|uniref:SusC/RagA family TonB-linked outer membrane protein n=1 Tax=Flavobacterium sp. ASW18X TaxID=2572595 RepID=UPI0010AEA43C|nr:TonB-dependent receptor [Flavobacterium sp. ASW18X]TKD57941.1 TonB-dependent receptor [Flavobacterium sp. ASW18X]
MNSLTIKQFIALTMKVYFICVIVALLNPLLASNVKAQKLDQVTVDLHLKQATIEEVITAIEYQTDFNFVYGRSITGIKNKYNLSYNKVSLRSVLELLAKDAGLAFRRLNYNISIDKRPKATKAIVESIFQEIKGKVLDENGQPLPGASVVEQGTTNGTATDFDGNFVLEVNPGAVLEVSYIGYNMELVTVGTQIEYNIQLSLASSSLQEVVLIGYGQQARAKVVGSVAAMKSKELQNVTAASVDQQLAGKLSGVIINQSNGQPGTDSQIIIRGTGTLTAGSNPLIVVDGFPLTEGSTLSSVNPNDIEDINILKDAASASIYGSRAANGVILITTKAGKFNQETRITLETYGGIQQQSSGVELVDAYEHAQFLTESRNWGYVSKDPLNRSETDPNSVRVTKLINGKQIDGRELFLPELEPYLNGVPGLLNTDWIDEGFRSAPITNYALSISGGNEKTTFFTSLGYFDQEGVVIGTDFKRYSASLNMQTKITDKIKFGVNLKPTYSVENSVDQGSRSNGVLGLISVSFPMYSPYYADGSIDISDQLVNEQREIEGVRVNGTPVENLVATANLITDEKSRFRIFGNAFLDAEIIKGLTYRFSLGGDYDTYVRDYYYPIGVGSYRTPAPRADANAEQRKQNKVNYLLENTLTFDRTFGKHHFNVLAGYTFQKEKIDYTRVVGTGFADDNIQNIGGASAFTATADVGIWALESYLGRVQYDFDDKYLVTAAIRRDGSSRFGVNNRWGNFPSIAGGWVFSRETFFPDSNILSFGKLSASWGQTGNNQIGTYASKALVTDSNYVFGNGIAPGYITTSAPNPDLGWEVASSLNIGLDLGFFNNKLNFNMAYYKTNTKDLLLDVPVPQQTGYDNVLANIGEMENQGWEFQIFGNGFKAGDLGIGFNANLTSYKNKVLALGPGQDRIATGRDQLFVTQIGRPIAEIYGYKLDGVFKTQEEIDNTPHLDGTLTGDLRVVDVNGDGQINDDDKIAKGTFAPDFTYGFGANLDYKGFNLSFNFVGVAGRTLLDGDLSSLTEAGEGFAVPTKYYFNNRYHPVNNPDGFLGQPNFGNFSNSRKILRSSVTVDENNGDYFRFRDVRLGYTFQKNILDKLQLQGLQVYLSGNNLFTATDWRGWNPDGTTSNILTSGYNSGGNYPIARTYTVGLKITY